VGGGNSAIDAARAVVRLGLKNTCLLPARKIDMPAEEEEVQAAEEEGINSISSSSYRILGKMEKW